MSNAETITVFLMDGDANGRIKASIENSICLGYKVPRDRLELCDKIKAFEQSSVYFLFGASVNGKDSVYVGQAGVRKAGGGILQRLKEHAANPDKNYWTDAIVFTTKDNSFGPTEISFLENLFCNKAHSAGRYEVKNANDPSPGNVTEEKECALIRFAEYAELILGVFGYKVFLPILKQGDNSSKENIFQKKEEKQKWHLDAGVLKKGGKPSSVYLKGYLVDSGYMPAASYFTIAKLNKDGKRFWANPPIEFLNGEWHLALNDPQAQKLHLFMIPKGAISHEAVKTRLIRTKSGKPRTQIDLEIVYKEAKFICIASGVDYSEWFIETVDY